MPVPRLIRELSMLHQIARHRPYHNKVFLVHDDGEYWFKGRDRNGVIYFVSMFCMNISHLSLRKLFRGAEARKEALLWAESQGFTVVDKQEWSNWRSW